MRPIISRHSASSQRGAVVIMTAGFMLLGVLFLVLVVDTGRLYMEKRSLQRIADVVALELASTEWCADGALIGDATVALNRNTPAGSNIAFKSGWPKCGTTSGSAPRVFTPSLIPEDGNAVQVEIIHSVAKSLVAGGYFSSDPNVNLWAVAVAARGGIPLAALTIRSTLATVDEGLLNAVVGGMLGGNVGLTLLSWEGLLDTDISLLTFIDALAVRIGISAGSYDQVLSAPVSVGNLLGAAIDALPMGTDADVLIGLNNLVNVAVGLPTITLGDLISVDSNAPSSALDVPLNLLQLVQGSAQLANGENVVAVDLPTIGIPGANASVKVKVIEPAQISAIGDPSEINLISKLPHEAPNIFVRTAQVRTLVTVNLSGVSDLLGNITSALTPLLSPIIDFIETTSVNPVGGLISGVGNLLANLLEDAALLVCLLLPTTTCNSSLSNVVNVVDVTALPQPISVSLDAASASGWVTDYSCITGNKSLDTKADTSVAYLRVGKMQESDVFSSGAIPLVEPAPVVEIFYRKFRARRTCSRPSIISFWSCSNEELWQQNDLSYQATENDDPNVKLYIIAGLGLKVDGPIGGSASPTLTYLDPPNIGEEPDFQPVPSPAVLSGLGTTLANGLQPYQSTAPGLLGDLLGGTLSLLSGVVSAVTSLLEGVIQGLLDPILNSLLSTLGADLAVTDLGANLTCNSDEGVRLLN